jgi:thiamine-monophosphate kinase
MRETGIVDAIRRRVSKGTRSALVVQGMGDDCAVLRPRAREDLVFTTDFVIEGRHFELATHSAQDIGHKALARSLSDLAAMGGEPVFCLVSLALPTTLAARWVKAFYDALLSLAARFQISLAGGDLASFEKVVVDVMCCGRVPRGKALLRSSAKAGDDVFVTGELGGSAHGFSVRRGAAWRRHLRPEPRLAAGTALRKLGATSCIDLSDGLSLDLARLCRESKAGAKLDGALPLARGASVEEALHGGEDYELLFTARPWAKIPKRIGRLPVTRIGTMVQAKAGQVWFGGRLLRPGGFDHFA